MAFADIRNAMEHRSLKIVDDFGYELATSHNNYNDEEFRKMQEEASTLSEEIREIELNIDQAKKMVIIIQTNSLKGKLIIRSQSS